VDAPSVNSIKNRLDKHWEDMDVTANKDGWKKPDISSELRFLLTPPAFDAPIRGGGAPVAMPFEVWHRKTIEWRGYQMVKKF